jgi:hypothetical protein
MNSINNIIADFWRYALGRGIISTAVIAASFIGSTPGMVAIAVGSVAWNVFTRHISQQRYEQNMLQFYSDEVAAAVDKSADEITVDDLKKAAYGDPYHDIPRNEVLSYALDRQKAKSWLSFGVAVVAGLATFGLIYAGLPGAVEHILGGSQNMLANFSTSIVAFTSSFIINNGMEAAIAKVSNITRLSAHDRILRVERTQSRGKDVGPTQVLDVFISANPTLEKRLRSEHKKRYSSMNHSEKTSVMEALGLTQFMTRLAEGLNNESIDATELAFIVNGAEPLSRRGRETLHGMTPQHPDAPPAPEQTAAHLVARLNAPQQRFADRIREEAETRRSSEYVNGIA